MDESRRGPGRPRKWASDAERARAYRQRRNEELAEPNQLRTELQTLRQRVSELARELERRDRAVTKVEAQLRGREREVTTLEADRDDLRRRLDRIVEQLDAARRTGPPASTASMTLQPRLPTTFGNRADRRAAARRERKQR